MIMVEAGGTAIEILSDNENSIVYAFENRYGTEISCILEKGDEEVRNIKIEIGKSYKLECELIGKKRITSNQRTFIKHCLVIKKAVEEKRDKKCV